MTRAGGAALLALALAVAGPADGAVLCRKGSGKVLLREACKKREQPVGLLKGPAGDAGAAARRAPRVVDATGAPVGILADPVAAEGGSTILVMAGDRVVVVDIDRLFDRQFFYTSSDCSGPRLVREQPDPLVRQATYLHGTLYYAEDPITPVTAMSNSFATEPADCTLFGGTVLPDGLCCASTSFASHFGPAAIAFSAAALGTPPFRLEF